MSRGIWGTLGIEPTNDAAEIKRAYARRLKQVHPEDDPTGFQALREAYDHATRMARNGWAVPTPVEDAEDDDFDEGYDHSIWSDLNRGDDRWRRPVPTGDAWQSQAPKRWSHDAAPERRPAPVEELPDDIRAELAQERALAEAHRALCDQLTALLAKPDGDKHEALSAMLRVLRSPGMVSLDTHDRTERWLAYVAAASGPVADELIEPLIHFFQWDAQRVGVDMSHAFPVLQRRDTGIALRRLERKMDPEHDAWLALRDKPDRRTRLRARLKPRFAARVLALLDRIERELPEVARRMSPEAVAWWRDRQAQPDLSPVFLWTLIIAPLLVGLVGAGSIAFGPPSWATFLALWTVSFSALLGAGTVWLHGIARPRLRWRNEDMAWDAPAWLRLGWAPITAVFLLVSSVLPVTVPWVAAYWLALGPLLLWTRIVCSHLEEAAPQRLGALLSAAPLFGWLVIHAHGPVGVSLCWTAAAAISIAHHGQSALEGVWVSIAEPRRRLIAAGLAVAAAMAVAAAILAPDWPLRTLAAAAVSLIVLAARPVRFTQAPAGAKLWLTWMRYGWVACAGAAWFSPAEVAAVATFWAGAAWLGGGALLTFLWDAAPRIGALFIPRKRKPGALA